MHKTLPFLVFLLSTAVIYAQATIRSESTTNPEIENLGGFKPDITTLMPDNNTISASFGSDEGVEEGELEGDSPESATRQNFDSKDYDLNDLILNIYPNPASDYLIVTLEQEVSGNISILNLVGNAIIDQPINALSMRIDITSLPEGIYFLNIQSDTGRVVKKIKVQK